MSPRTRVAQLRQALRELAEEAEPELPERYSLRFPPRERMSLYRRFRVAVGRVLRDLGLRRTRPPEPWLPSLRHLDGSDGAKPFLIWALDADRDTLRSACPAFAAALPEFVPVLVTDVADFAFFSRLGWLVEYVPALSAPAGRYAERKRRYLAWRYRDLPALPLSIGLEQDIEIKELLVD
jgi:hypothetical protein